MATGTAFGIELADRQEFRQDSVTPVACDMSWPNKAFTGVSSVFATGFTQPYGITVGLDGRYYVAGTGAIDVVGSSGGNAAVWSAGKSLGNGSFLSFDAGKLYVTQISEVDYFDAGTGQYQGFFSTGFRNTTGITVRPSGSAAPETSTLAVLMLGGLSGVSVHLRRRRTTSAPAES